jgi:hypothetical protein
MFKSKLTYIQRSDCISILYESETILACWINSDLGNIISYLPTLTLVELTQALEALSDVLPIKRKNLEVRFKYYG